MLEKNYILFVFVQGLFQGTLYLVLPFVSMKCKNPFLGASNQYDSNMGEQKERGELRNR